MLKLGRVNKFKMLFLVLVFVFNFDLFKFSTAILEKGLLNERCVLTVVALILIGLFMCTSNQLYAWFFSCVYLSM